MSAKGKTDAAGKAPRSKGAFLRRTFLAGFVILLPLFVTYILLRFLFNLLSGVGAPLVNGAVHAVAAFGVEGVEGAAWLPYAVPLVNLILSLLIVFLLGLLGTNVLGKRALKALDAAILRMPLVKSIYGGTKQVIETFKSSGAGNFQKVVLVEYPRKGLWSVGLVAAERPDAANLSSAKTLLAVFVATTPNPTSGFLVMVPKEDAIEIDYDVEDAFKLIVSGGLVGDVMRRKGGEAAKQ